MLFCRCYLKVYSTTFLAIARTNFSLNFSKKIHLSEFKLIELWFYIHTILETYQTMRIIA